MAEAGLDYYNHNIDTSPEHYENIVSTHTFQDRLNTLKHVQDAGMAVCCGGILGLGEQPEDRLRMLEILSNLDPHPESVPINVLMPMPGTPLEGADPVDSFDLVKNLIEETVQWVAPPSGGKAIRPSQLESGYKLHNMILVLPLLGALLQVRLTQFERERLVNSQRRQQL